MYLKWLIVGVFMVLNSAVQAGDIELGKSLSVRCMGCHGVDGNSANTTIPSLAGKEIAYLINRLNAYQDGSIANPLMNGVAGGLSDTEIANLAAYYSALRN